MFRKNIIFLVLIISYCRADAEPLDLSLPKDVLKPTPIYIVNPSSPPLVRAYAESIRAQINQQANSIPMLDRYGNYFCLEQQADFLIALDKQGTFYSVQTIQQSGQDPLGVREAGRSNLDKIVRALSPFPPFPESEKLNYRLVGIHLMVPSNCKGMRKAITK